MVTKRIRSEYMNKFKDPKWETYARCYEDLVNYRLSRRLLEQAHNPWFWDECGSDSESSYKSTPSHKSQVEPQHLQEEVEPAPVLQTAGPVSTQTNPVQEKEPKTGQVRDEVVEDFKPEKGEEKSKVQSPVRGVVQPETSPCVQNKTRCKLWYSQKPLRSKAMNHLTKDTDKDSRHPFAMYGSGERQADMASKRTHNVGPAASTKEIHESALRAKTRRETEKQMKKVVRRRVKSADIEKKINKIKINPDYNPWMTEYMRCFSARSQ